MVSLWSPGVRPPALGTQNKPRNVACPNWSPTEQLIGTSSIWKCGEGFHNLFLMCPLQLDCLHARTLIEDCNSSL